MGDEEILRKLLVVTTRTETKLDAHLAQGAQEHTALVARITALEGQPKTFLRQYAIPLSVCGTIVSTIMGVVSFLVLHH